MSKVIEISIIEVRELIVVSTPCSEPTPSPRLGVMPIPTQAPVLEDVPIQLGFPIPMHVPAGK